METELTISVNGHQGTGGDEDGPEHASGSAGDSPDNLRLLRDATLDPTVIPSQNGRQEPRKAQDSTDPGSRSAAASTDNLRMLRGADLIAQLRADVRRQAADLRRQTAALVKAERRAERAETRLKGTKKKRAKRPPCETPEYAELVEKSMERWGLRVADGDPSDLMRLREFRKKHDAAIAVGAAGLHANGASWTEIAAAVGITRQGALKRWGGPDAAAPLSSDNSRGDLDRDVVAGVGVDGGSDG